MSRDDLRVALHSMGIPVEDDWIIQEMSVKRDIETVQLEPDVYGNECSGVVVRGQQVTLVVYRAEN